MELSLVQEIKILSQISSVLRHDPEKQETVEDRSRARYRLAAFSGSATLLAKVISIGTSLVTVRLALRYLGNERYGMWMTISSIVMMMGLADLGMSSGLVNLVADAMGRGDREAARRASASAFWMLSTVAIALCFLFAIVYPFVNKAALFNVHSTVASREAGPALICFFVCFVANLPLGAVRSVQTGLQKGFINSLWAIAGTVGSLVALLVAIHMHAGLPMLVLSMSGPPVIGLVLNGIELFGWSHPELSPSLRFFKRESASRLSRIGFMFFLLQLSLAIGMQTDNIVVAQIMGADSVAAYAVPARMFNVVISLLGMVSGVMWPAYADAVARQDADWIRRGFKRVTLVGTLIAALATVFLVLFGNQILRIWVGPQISASMQLLIAFSAQCVLYAYLQPISYLLNGIQRLREQVIYSIMMAVANLCLSILFVRAYGIIGAVLGTVVSLVLVQVVPLTLVTARTLRSLEFTWQSTKIQSSTE